MFQRLGMVFGAWPSLASLLWRSIVGLPCQAYKGIVR